MSSKYIFTIETDELEELDIYQKAHANSYILFELRHNFHRKFKHLDGKHEEFYRGVELVLDELDNLIRERYED